MAGHHEADREKRKLTCLMHDGPQRVGEDALERHSAFADSRDNAGESRLCEHNPGRGFCDIGRGGDRNSDLSLAQSRCIIGAVAAHADDVPGVLETLDDAVFVLGKNARKDSEFLGANRIVDRLKPESPSGGPREAAG